MSNPVPLLLETLGKDGAAVIAPHLTEEAVAEGERVFTDGEVSSRLVLLVSGGLQACHEDGGHRIVLGDIPIGSWLGEVGFIDRGPATATVVATKPSTIMTIHHRQLMALAETEPHAASVLLRHVTRALAKRLHKSTSGIVTQIADGQFKVMPVEQQRGWLASVLGRLLGTEAT